MTRYESALWKMVMISLTCILIVGWAVYLLLPSIDIFLTTPIYPTPKKYMAPKNWISHQPVLNTTFGQLIPTQLIGSGAEGNVHEYYLKGNGSIFAVKSVERNRFRHNSYMEQHIAPRMQHENVMEIPEHLVHNRTYYQIMKHYPNGFWKNESRTPNDAACKFRQLLSGVSYLHSEGVVHFDLKASNVMLDRGGQMKIIDFGHAQYFLRALGSVKRILWLERDAPKGGTIGYNAPEKRIYYSTSKRYDRLSHDIRTIDIWALAVLYCRMVLPRMLWEHDEVPAPLSDEDDWAGWFVDPAVKDWHKAQNKTTKRSADVEWEIATNALNGTKYLKPSEPQSMCNTRDMSMTDRMLTEVTVDTITKLLPIESRSLISKMLAFDPVDRISWPDIWADEWVRGIKCPLDDSVNGFKALVTETRVRTVIIT